MEYRDFEARLAELHQITEETMGAFRARLRVLREAGIPAVEKVGKGSRVHFAVEHLAETHIALALSEFGMTPSRIGQVVNIVRRIPGWPPQARSKDFLVLTLRAPIGNLNDFSDRAGVIRAGIVSDATLLEMLREPLYNKVLTWNAVVSLERFSADIHGASMRE